MDQKINAIMNLTLKTKTYELESNISLESMD